MSTPPTLVVGYGTLYLGRYYVMCGCYRKRPRLDRDEELGDLAVKTEPFIPGLDLVEEVDIKDEDVSDTGAASLQRSLRFTLGLVMNENFQ